MSSPVGLEVSCLSVCLSVAYSSANLDVSMAHPLSSDSIKGAAAESGYAAKKI